MTPATPPAETTTAPGSESRAAHATRTYPWWLVVLVIVGALGVLSLAYSALFSPSTLLPTGQHVTEAARVWARYAAAYSASLGGALLVLLAARARHLLAGVLVQAVLAQVLLAIVGVADRRWEQIPADIVLVAAFAICAARLVRHPEPPARLARG